MKHLYLSQLLLTISILGCGQPDNKIPALIKPGDPGFISSELIYPLTSKPTAECHASTIVELSDGLMAAWFGGTYERNPDVGIWTSINKNGVWSNPVQVVNGFQNDSLRYPCWNPVLFKPAKGPLMLFYKVGPSPSEWWGMLTTSADEGRTWTIPTRLGKDPAVSDLLGPVKNKPIQLADGSILCPSSTEVEINDKDKWRVHFELTSILTYADGRMQILCRTQEGKVSESWSSDNGKTWSQMKASSLPNPNSGTDAVTLKDGRQLIVYNHTVRKGDFPSGRHMLNVAVSTDGKKWKTIATLERSEGEYSYPAVIQTASEQVHITYTYLRKAIRHVVLDVSKLN